jgi:predicted transposase/invertase (TIGR01784 family)
MGDPEIAHSFLQAHLPKAIQGKMNLNQLHYEPGSFIDDELQESLTDILYSVPYDGKKGLIYILVEHQSKPDPAMPLRMINYMLRIINKYYEERSKISVIYPIVFYNGKEKYSYTTDFYEMFDNPTLARELMFKSFQLIDVGKISDETLREHAWASVLQLCMKHIHAEDMLPHIEAMLDKLQALEQDGRSGLVSAALIYCLVRGGIRDIAAFNDIIRKRFTQKTGDEIMTGGDILRLEGMQQGMQKGKLEIALKLLQRGESLYTVAEITGLKESILKNLLKQGAVEVS